jgi:hypothetical protein
MGKNSITFRPRTSTNINTRVNGTAKRQRKICYFCQNPKQSIVFVQWLQLYGEIERNRVLFVHVPNSYFS